MNAYRFDRFAKTLVAAGSRRSVIGGLLGGVIALSRIGAAGATHKTGHHCAPTDNHACTAPQTCREVDGEWTCQDPKPPALSGGRLARVTQSAARISCRHPCSVASRHLMRDQSATPTVWTEHQLPRDAVLSPMARRLRQQRRVLRNALLLR
jgi:hypothetical protein